MPYSKTILCLTLMLTATQVVLAEEDERLSGRLQAHIEFLASDLMLGRQPGTPQYDIAAAYVASQFRQMGLLPAGDDGSYLQQVPMRESLQVPGSASLSLLRDGDLREFVFVEEFYTRPSQAHLESEVDAEMVFVGYGIDAPELDHRDYEGVDVGGKVVVAIGGQPHDFPSEEGAHFASGRERVRAAMEAGAIGMISIYTPRSEKRFAWDRIGNLVGTPSQGWITPDGEVFASPAQIQGGAFLHYTPAADLFEGADYSMEEILRRDQDAEDIPAFELPGRVMMRQQSVHETIYSPNVAAFLPGSDPLLNNEYVVYTAHLDHIGQIPGEGHADSINNGAMDNASGVSVMLETARLFSEREAPRRSVMFVAVTAEEKGLVGSEYFAQYPTVPVDKLVAVINLDMPVLLFEFTDVIAFGASHSSLGASVATAAHEAGIELSPDPVPEQNIFVRSDHYRFVQRGIPSIFLVTGGKALEGGADATVITDFMSGHYHKPSDDLNLPINYHAAARFTRINTRIGEIVANDPERPTWFEGDFFGELFSP